MDYDAVANLSVDSDGSLSDYGSRSRLPQEIVLTLFFIVGMCADFAIFYTIFRFNRLRSIPNIFLANWAIADFLCLMLTPSAYHIISFIGHSAITHDFLCILEEFGGILHITIFLFIIVALIDWFIAAYFGGTTEKFRNNYRVVIGTIWLFAIVFASTFTGVCMHYTTYYIHNIIMLIMCYIACLFLVLMLQISKIVQKYRMRPTDNTNLNLTLATAYTIFSFLSFINLLVVQGFTDHPAVEVLAIVMLFSSSVMNLGLLFFLDRDFNACLLQAIRCSRGGYRDSIAGEFDNPIRDTNGKSSSNVDFRTSQELLTNSD